MASARICPLIEYSAQNVAVETTFAPWGQKLTFGQRAGKNVILSIDRRLAERKDAENETSFGGLVTERPLMDEEKFIIELSGTVDRWGGHSIGIGVTSTSAENMDFPPWMSLSRHNIWMMYYYEGWPGRFCVYHNWMEMCRQCGSNKLQQPKIGDQFCVARERNGNLLFYINGKIEGKVLLNSWDIMYGVVEVRGNAKQVTIVDSF